MAARKTNEQFRREVEDAKDFIGAPGHQEQRRLNQLNKYTEPSMKMRYLWIPEKAGLHIITEVN